MPYWRANTTKIVSLLPYSADANIQVNYERRDNVLDLDVIRHLELLGKILVAIYESRHDEANALLPELLTHPAWNIDPVDIWKLGLKARNSHTTWLEIMATTPTFVPLHTWLITTAAAIPHLPLERILDIMIGRVEESTIQPLFTSPLFRYFFSPQNLTEHPDEYLTYLEALRTIRTKLREYHPAEQPHLQTLLEFIALHRQLGSTITSLRPNVEQIDNAVNLMTSHKSKGLEFDTVYTRRY